MRPPAACWRRQKASQSGGPIQRGVVYAAGAAGRKPRTLQVVAGGCVCECGEGLPRRFEHAEIVRQRLQRVGHQGGAEGGDARAPERGQHGCGFVRLKPRVVEIHPGEAVDLDIDEPGRKPGFLRGGGFDGANHAAGDLQAGAPEPRHITG